MDTCILHIMDLLGYGCFLLNQSRQVVTHNRIAVNCLGDGLTISERCVIATDHPSNERLQSLIMNALEKTDSSHKSSRIAVRRNDSLPLMIHIVPLGEDAPSVMAKLLVIVCAPDLIRQSLQNSLMDFFDLKLSNREVICLSWIARGKSSWEIGKIMNISVNTVNFHIKNALKKLNSSSRTLAIVKAIQLGIIDYPCEDTSGDWERRV